MESNKKEIVFGIVVIALLLALINPFWMPSMMLMTALLVLALVFLAFAGFVWKEKSQDEREELHVLIAGKFGFLLGALVLVAGIIVQGFQHQIDNWLVAALAFMILGKIAGLIYGKQKK